MLNFTSSFTRYCVSIKHILLFAVAFALSGDLFAQLFQQQFGTALSTFTNSCTANATYVNTTTPSNSQFTGMCSGSIIRNVAVSGGVLSYTSSSGTGSFVRNVAFSPVPNSLMISMDVNITGNSFNNRDVFTFYSGQSMTNDAGTAPAAANVHSQFTVNCPTASSSVWRVKNSSGAFGTTASFSGSRTILFVINNSGGTLTYKAPNGSFESVDNDKWDLWVGTSREFDEQLAITAASAITQFKMIKASENNQCTFDNILMDPIPGTPNCLATSSVGNNSFTVNWSAVSGATTYFLDVSTDSNFGSFVPGYNNLNVGNVTSQVIGGLTEGTTYYYRVSTASVYTVSTLQGGGCTGSQQTTGRTITTGAISASLIHAGGCIDVPYTVSAALDAGNIFTAQLSDVNGSFGAPTIIGTLSSVNSGVISGTIPVSAAYGTNYRVRVVGSNPGVTGNDNGFDLTIIGLLFQQEFSTALATFSNSCTANATYVNTTNPSTSQFTAICSNASSRDVSVSGGTLNFTGSGSQPAAVTRNVSFTPVPSSLMFQIDVNILSATFTNRDALTVYVGNTANNDGNTAMTAANTHSQFTVNLPTNSTTWRVKNSSGGFGATPSFSGKLPILFVINNSGAPMKYRAPDGSDQSVGDDKYDLWVSTSLEFDEGSATTVGATLSQFKILKAGESNTESVDNILIDIIPTPPVATTATGIGDNGFTANWNGVTDGSAGNYFLDVSTDPAFGSFVSGFNNLNVGCVTSYVITGLSEGTTYYYRVRSGNIYTISTYQSGNSNVITQKTTGREISTGTISGSPFCYGDPVSIPYTLTGGTMNAGNVFTAQLSDANGSFAFPTNIGTLGSLTSGVINGTIPVGTPSGAGYRIRVIGNNPGINGADNGEDIVITGKATVEFLPASQTLCSGSSAFISLSSNQASAIFNWTVMNGPDITGGTDCFSGCGTTISEVLYNSGITSGTSIYTVSATDNGCAGESNPVTITVLPEPSITSVTATPNSVNCSGTFELSVTVPPGTDYEWFSDVTGTTQPAGAVTNSPYTTPTLSSTTSYWVEPSISTNATAGKVSPTTTGTLGTSARPGLLFDAYSPFTLKSVDIWTGGSLSANASVTVYLINSSNVIQMTSAPKTLVASSANTVNLNWLIPVGANWRLAYSTSGGSADAMRQDNSGLAFPYDIGTGAVFGKITSGSQSINVASPTFTTATYRDLFNWQVGVVCIGPRTEVVATVNTSFTITSSVSGGIGTINPIDVETVVCDENRTYTITPDPCYNIYDVVVDGSSVGAVGSYTFSNITDNHTIDVSFVLKTYTINVSKVGNGIVTPLGSNQVNCDDNLTINITPDACHHIMDVVIDGTSYGSIISHTFSNINANHTVSVTFAVDVYVINATAGANGSIIPPGGSGGNVNVNCGNNQPFSFIPNAGYVVQNVNVDGTNLGPLSNYIFSNVTADHSIIVTFVEETYTIDATASLNGSINPSGTLKFTPGSSQTYFMTADPCYYIGDVIVDGVSVGPVSSYTFSDIRANHTIDVLFGLSSYTITSTTGFGGTITPSTIVDCGTNATFNIVPSAGCFTIEDVLVDGISVGALSSYTFTNITADHTIEALFTPITQITSVTSNRAFDDICKGGDVTLAVAGTLAGGAHWQWYSGGCPSGTAIAGATNDSYTVSPSLTSTYYVRAEGGSCPPGECSSITITVSTGKPTEKFMITSAPSVGYVGSTGTICGNVVPGATAYHWSANRGIVFSNGLTSIETKTNCVTFTIVSAESNYNVSGFAFNSCGRTNTATTSSFGGIRGTVSMTTGITGLLTACPNQTNVSYTANTIANTTGYFWSLSPSTAGVINNNGNKTITVNFSAGFTTAQLCVHGRTIFGLDGPDFCITISSSPATATTPSGPGSVCGGNSYNYSTTATGAASFLWYLNGNLVSGTGSSNTIAFPSGYSGGTVCVVAVSACGQTSAQSCLDIDASAPPSVGPILSNMPSSGLCDADGVTFYISQSDASAYSWTVPACATIISTPPYSQAIVVNFSNCIGGTVQVDATYACGVSSATLAVTGVPAAPVVTPDYICSDATDGYFQVYPPSSGADGYTWNVTNGFSFNLAFDNSDAQIFWDLPATSGVTYFTVTADNNCGSSASTTVDNVMSCRLAGNPDMIARLNANVYPNPTDGLITVEFNTDANNKYVISVSDIAGRLINSEVFHSVEGLNQYIVDLSRISKGMYLVKLTNESGESFVSRISVQ